METVRCDPSGRKFHVLYGFGGSIIAVKRETLLLLCHLFGNIVCGLQILVYYRYMYNIYIYILCICTMYSI